MSVDSLGFCPLQTLEFTADQVIFTIHYVNKIIWNHVGDTASIHEKNIFEEEYDSKTLDEYKPVVEDIEMK
jgi:hypothetical protein